MWKKRMPWLVLTFVLAWLGGFTLSYVLTNSGFWQETHKKPLGDKPLSLNESRTVGVLPKEIRIREEVYYSKCRHLIQRETSVGELGSDIDEESLKKSGWTLYHNHDGSITIFKTINGLCPEDAEKRHLGVAGEFVCVVAGPVGVEGEILEVLDIKVANLPLEWQEKVKKGELAFASEKELLEALDSIDEYE